jgi:APA family basic amino acid/polyamine antiporter
MSAQPNHLFRVLGIAFGLAAVVGSVVGQGILRSPGIVAQASGSPAVLIGLWAAGAAFSLLAALPFAELGAAIPRAGGAIAFAERAFGPRMRVVAAFTLVLLMVSSQAMLAFVTGEFLVRLGVGGGRLGPGEIALALLLLFFGANAMGTRATGALQIGLSTLKGAVLIGLVVILFSQPGAASDTNPPPAISAGWFGFGAAMLVIIGAYNGWGDLVVYGEEIENPGRSIPRALFGGIIGVAVLYLAVNLALLHSLTPAEMARSDFAAADAARSVFGDRGDTIFTMFGVLSVGAITSLGLMSTSRVVFATARAGILPQWFSRVTPRGTPMRALGLSTAGSAAFLLSNAYLALSATSNTLSQGMFVLVALAAIALRRSEPDMPRPFRMPLYPLSGWLALGFDTILLIVFVAQDPFYSMLGLVLVAALSAGYLALARFRAAPPGEPIEWPSPS